MMLGSSCSRALWTTSGLAGSSHATDDANGVAHAGVSRWIPIGFLHGPFSLGRRADAHRYAI